MYYFGKFEENMDLSRIYLAVLVNNLRDFWEFMYHVSLVFCRYTVQTLFMGDPLGTARVGVPLIQHQ